MWYNEKTGEPHLFRFAALPGQNNFVQLLKI